MATILRQKGYDVTSIDAIAEGLSRAELIKRIQKIKPDIVGLTALTEQVYEASLLAKKIKEMSPEVKTILGGYHASALPEQTLKEFSSFDYLVYGEGELTLPELLKAIASNNRDVLRSIQGIAYRDGKDVVVTPQRPYLDVNALPPLDFEGFDLKLYRPFYVFPNHKITELPVMTSRGCPYDCVFCFRTIGKIIRYRDVHLVINEIIRDIEVYHANRITFMDDTFTINMKRAESICDELIKTGIHKEITWNCATRADVVHAPLLKKMQQAGCRIISYGIESGDQAILDKAVKGLKIEEIKNAITWTKDAGIDIYANFIIGLPYDTVDSINRTIDLANSLDIDAALFSVLTPFPGTGLIDMVKDGRGGLKMISNDWRDYNKHVGRSLELDTVSINQLEKLQRKAYMRFYLRPQKFMNMFKIVRLGTLMSYLFRRFIFKNLSINRIHD